MEKISQLMDGELGRREAEATIKVLRSDQALAESWETYHLIGDAMRREAELRPDFVRRLHERLEQEPTVVAPHTRLSHRVVRYTLPLAAGVAGITLVVWLAMNTGQPPAVAVRTASGSGMSSGRNQAETRESIACLADPARAAKAAGSWTARSASALRSSSQPASFSPCMNWL